MSKNLQDIEQSVRKFLRFLSGKSPRQREPELPGAAGAVRGRRTSLLPNGERYSTIKHYTAKAVRGRRNEPAGQRKEAAALKNTTLCYLENGCGAYLMLHRVKKEHDLNRDKWVGVGGKFEGTESPDECLLREVREETGVTLTRFRFRGVVTFLSDCWEGEFMYLFTADRWEGEFSQDCPEGVLEWIPRERVYDLPIWEGDKLFFRLLEEDGPAFLLTLSYEGDRLVRAVLNGRTRPLDT